jgi:hypothetical protein
MTFKEDIEKKYTALLAIAEQYESCLEGEETRSFGSRSMSIKEGADEKYWKTRSELEVQLPEFMQLLRKAIGDIPSSEKKYTTYSRTDFSTNEEYSEKIYNNENFGALIFFFEKIQNAIESHSGVLYDISDTKLILSQLRNTRGNVLSFSHILDLFIPEKMITIEKEVETTLKLRELGLEKVAQELESIDDEEDNLKKCVNARTALEQIVLGFCEKNGIKPSSFYFNLDNAVSKGMTEKAQQKSIAALYSFISKVVHKDIDADSKNTQYAIYGVYNIIGSLIRKNETKKTETQVNTTTTEKV